MRIQSEGGDAPGLMDAVVAAGMPAVALTDQSNLFAMVKFYRAAQAAGVKPIVGVDLRVREPGERIEPSTLVLLCQNEIGYRNLTRLVSRSYLEGQQRGLATIERAWLDADNLVGLIALSGARDGDFGRALVHGREDEARRALDSWLALFGDRYYIELQRTRREAEERYIHGALDLAAEYGVPVVATNDVRFIRAADFDSHEARVCIHDGALVGDAKRRSRYSKEQYLKSPRQMAQLFEDVPEAVANSFEIATSLQPGAEARQIGAAGVSGARQSQHRGLPARGGAARSARAPAAAEQRRPCKAARLRGTNTRSVSRSSSA